MKIFDRQIEIGVTDRQPSRDDITAGAGMLPGPRTWNPVELRSQLLKRLRKIRRQGLNLIFSEQGFRRDLFREPA